MADIGYDAFKFQLIDDALFNSLAIECDKDDFIPVGTVGAVVNPISTVETNRGLSRVLSIKAKRQAVVNRVMSRLDETDTTALTKRKGYSLGNSITLKVLPSQRLKDVISVRQTKSSKGKYDEGIGGYVGENRESVDTLFSPYYLDERCRDFSYLKSKAPLDKGGCFYIQRLGSRYTYQGYSSQIIHHRDVTGRDCEVARVIKVGDTYDISIIPNPILTPYVLTKLMEWIRKPVIELVGAYTFDDWTYKSIVDTDETTLLSIVPLDREEFLQFFNRFESHSLVRLGEFTNEMSDLLSEFFVGFGRSLLYARHESGIGVYRSKTGLPQYLSDWFKDFPIAPRMTLVSKGKNDRKQWRKAGIKKGVQPARIKSSFYVL